MGIKFMNGCCIFICLKFKKIMWCCEYDHLFSTRICFWVLHLLTNGGGSGVSITGAATAAGLGIVTAGAVGAAGASIAASVGGEAATTTDLGSDVAAAARLFSPAVVSCVLDSGGSILLVILN